MLNCILNIDYLKKIKIYLNYSFQDNCFLLNSNDCLLYNYENCENTECNYIQMQNLLNILAQNISNTQNKCV